MGTAIIVASAAVLLLGISGLGVVVWAISSRRTAAGKAPESPLEARVAALEIKVAGLPSLWESERKRVEQHAERARKAEKSARRIREEIEEEPEEDPDLFAVDARGSNGRPMRALHAQLEGGGSPDASPLEQARRALVQQQLGPFVKS